MKVKVTVEIDVDGKYCGKCIGLMESCLENGHCVTLICGLFPYYDGEFPILEKKRKIKRCGKCLRATGEYDAKH